jgi:hypothetical protein
MTWGEVRAKKLKQRHERRKQQRQERMERTGASIAVEGEGDPCPRCGRPMQIREHCRITEKQLRQPFYYSRWFLCCNPRCRTTLFMPERFKVVHGPRKPLDEPVKDTTSPETLRREAKLKLSVNQQHK